MNNELKDIVDRLAGLDKDKAHWEIQEAQKTNDGRWVLTIVCVAEQRSNADV